VGAAVSVAGLGYAGDVFEWSGGEVAQVKELYDWPGLPGWGTRRWVGAWGQGWREAAGVVQAPGVEGQDSAEAVQQTVAGWCGGGGAQGAVAYTAPG